MTLPLRPISQGNVCFVACDAGPANHFSVFAKYLETNGFHVKIFAAEGAASNKFLENKIKVITFSINKDDEQTQKAVAEALAKKCSEATQLVISDMGNQFDLKLQESLAKHSDSIVHLAYYDNPESWVPGGYSERVAHVVKVAQKTIFANSHLAFQPIYDFYPEHQIDLPSSQRIGLGYYSLKESEQIAGLRKTNKLSARKEFFCKHSIVDKGQKILVYFGSNSEEYFNSALPQFLEILDKCENKNIIILFQQHPGAKELNIEGDLVENNKQIEHSNKIQDMIVSNLSITEAQILADAAIYFQTSMSPQFVLAGIPTFQIGDSNVDILVKNNLCHVIKKGSDLDDAIKTIEREKIKTKKDYELILDNLGVKSIWPVLLTNTIKNEIKHLRQRSNKEKARKNAERKDLLQGVVSVGLVVAVAGVFVKLYKGSSSQ